MCLRATINKDVKGREQRWQSKMWRKTFKMERFYWGKMKRLTSDM
jgi:hypothetical protein